MSRDIISPHVSLDNFNDAFCSYQTHLAEVHIAEVGSQDHPQLSSEQAFSGNN
jgi:hypothetical protein